MRKTAPQVGLEPTTLRQQAGRLQRQTQVLPSVATEFQPVNSPARAKKLRSNRPQTVPAFLLRVLFAGRVQEWGIVS